MDKEFFRSIDSLEEDTYYPSKDNIFKVFEMSLNDIKVVILGQDPYIREGQAKGLAFAIPETMNKPPSLRNIEKELGYELDVTLTSWVNQGVFLLNTALTVERGKSGSHIKLWSEFTRKVIKYISEENPCIWILWGKYAQDFSNYMSNFVYEYPRLDELDMNVLLIAAHPAAEIYRPNAGFFGCGHFVKANNILKTIDKEIINW